MWTVCTGHLRSLLDTANDFLWDTSPKLQKYYLVHFWNSKSTNQPGATNTNISWICILPKNIYMLAHIVIIFPKRTTHPQVPKGRNLPFAHSGWKRVHPLMGQLLSQQVTKCKEPTQQKHLFYHSCTLTCPLNLCESLLLHPAPPQQRQVCPHSPWHWSRQRDTDPFWKGECSRHAWLLLTRTLPLGLPMFEALITQNAKSRSSSLEAKFRKPGLQGHFYIKRFSKLQQGKKKKSI